MAEASSSLFKAECIRNPAMRPPGGWRSISDVEISTAEYVDWFNHRRLHGELGQVPPTTSRPSTGRPATPSLTLTTSPPQGSTPDKRAPTKHGAHFIPGRGRQAGA